ncbi:MAG: biopolymer transporter ExbD [Spirulinaceae cyanobacterium]
MRFREQKELGKIPEVDLTPLLDVLMSVLTFFIISSMTLTGQNIANLELPGSSNSSEINQAEEKLIIALDKDRKITIEGKEVNQAELAEKIKTYLKEKPESTIIFKADRSLPYFEIKQLVNEMAKVAKKKVSFAIQII